MTVATGQESPWPWRFAYAAAFLFTLGSTGTNLVYGWQKGTDLPSSVIWSAVSLGASILFALSWPAMFSSIERRRWSGSVIAAIALLLTGSYNVTAALGSAMDGRANASALEEV